MLELGLDSQALTTFGAACIDHSAATASFHANHKAMGTGATGFRRLVSAFHDLSKKLSPEQIRETSDYLKLLTGLQIFICTLFSFPFLNLFAICLPCG